MEQALISLANDKAHAAAHLQHYLDEKYPKPPLISLCLIVGNVEEYIERCLKSFLPIVDEICIARAIGNLVPDKTIEIAEQTCKNYLETRDSSSFFKWTEYLNRTVHQSWPHLDDFAAARNASFSLATGRFCFWVDSDDILEFGAEAIRADAEEDKYPLYLFPYRIFGRDVNISRERMMRRGSGKWIYPVHECFDFDPPAAGALDERARVMHLPDLHKTGSNDRNLRILESVPENELTPGLKYHLHGELLGTKNHEKAIKIGMEAAVSSDLGVPERYEIFLNLGKLAKKPELAQQLYHQAYQLDPIRREALGLLACSCMDYGKTHEALAYARAMIALPPPENANWNDRRSAYEWLGIDIYTQACRAHAKFRKLSEKKTREYLSEAERLRVEVLDEARKSKRPIISLIHATRGRPRQASKARKMWLDVADRPDAIEHIFIYGEDDEKSYPLARMHHLMIPPGQGCVGGWNAGCAAATGDILIQMSDDWVPPLQWDTKIIERLGDLKSPRVLAISDGHRKDDLLCMAIMTRAYYCQDWFMFHPRFFGVYSDNWFTREAYRRGMVVDAKDLVFTHDHPYFNKDKEIDETYAIQNDPKRYQEGKAIFDDLCKGNDWSSVPGWFNFWPFYKMMAQLFSDGDVAAEIGVWQGRSIIMLAQECKRLGKNVKFLAVDNFQGEPGVKEHASVVAAVSAAGSSLKGEFIKNVYRCGVADMITVLEGDSVKIARQIPTGHLAFCFIDASHDYENVRNDITAWSPKVKPDHCIAGHDAEWPAVRKAVIERFGEKTLVNGPIWMAKT